LLITFLFVAGIGSSVGSVVSDALELDADLVTTNPRFPCARGEVEFTRDAEGKRAFEVEVAGLPPGREIPVIVDGIVVATLEVDSCGRGELEFADDPEPGEAAFPTNFPTGLRGNIVRVGPLQGQLRVDPDDDDEAVVTLDADLFARMPSCMQGEAEFTRDAEREREFSVEVEGMESNSSFPVLVKGVRVGTIETDACGTGELEFVDDPDPDETGFPTGFPGGLRDQRVSVGPLRGLLQVED
jgi:hypothetical protein